MIVAIVYAEKPCYAMIIRCENINRRGKFKRILVWKIYVHW